MNQPRIPSGIPGILLITLIFFTHHVSLSIFRRARIVIRNCTTVFISHHQRLIALMASLRRSNVGRRARRTRGAAGRRKRISRTGFGSQQVCSCILLRPTLLKLLPFTLPQSPNATTQPRERVVLSKNRKCPALRDPTRRTRNEHHPYRPITHSPQCAPAQLDQPAMTPGGH